MCLQCTTNAILVKENIIPGYNLMESQVGHIDWPGGLYGLVRSNDPDFVLYDLLSDPTNDMSDNEIAALADDDPRWIQHEEHTRLCFDEAKRFVCDPMKGYSFVNACIQAGYKPQEHGSNVIMWFVDYAARQVGK